MTGEARIDDRRARVDAHAGRSGGMAGVHRPLEEIVLVRFDGPGDRTRRLKRSRSPKLARPPQDRAKSSSVGGRPPPIHEQHRHAKWVATIGEREARKRARDLLDPRVDEEVDGGRKVHLLVPQPPIEGGREAPEIPGNLCVGQKLEQPASLRRFSQIADIVMDRAGPELGADRDIPAGGLVFALGLGCGLEVERAPGRSANMIAEDVIGLLALLGQQAPGLDLEMVDEVSTQRFASGKRAIVRLFVKQKQEPGCFQSSGREDERVSCRRSDACH